MKILLTGPNGNLGQALQRHGQNHAWVGLGRTQWRSLPRLIADTEIIIHAASDLTTPLWREPKAVMESNLTSTLRLLEALPTANTKLKRFIFISSCAIYGRSEETREDVTPTPISVNGITKLLNEEIIRTYCTHHGISYQIFRVFNTFGGEDRFSIVHHLRQSITSDTPFTMYNDGISQRDFVHVDDIACVILSLLSTPLTHPVLNIGSGNVTRIREIVDAFRQTHPTLKITPATRAEAEYSRADIRKLRELLPDYTFRTVLDYIRDDLTVTLPHSRAIEVTR